MLMPYNRERCKSCGRAATPKRPISARSLCMDCAVQRQTEAITEMSEGAGPIHDRYAENRRVAMLRELEEAGWVE
jgi:hypothetical protein